MTRAAALFGHYMAWRYGNCVREHRRAASALALACALGVTSATAQGIRPEFGIGVGRTIATGAFRGDSSGDGFNDAWTGMVGVTLHRSRSPLGLCLDVAYSAHGANDQLKSDLSTRLGQSADESTKLLGANAGLTLALARTSPVAPHLFAGVGVYHVTISVTAGGTTTDNSATRLAWHVGGGVTYRALFLDIRYVSVAAVRGFPKTTLFPVTAGVRFGERSTN
jgi:opacity protein-like surface antigen